MIPRRIGQQLPCSVLQFVGIHQQCSRAFSPRGNRLDHLAVEGLSTEAVITPMIELSLARGRERSGTPSAPRR